MLLIISKGVFQCAWLRIARLGMAGVLHSVSLYMLPCSGKVISVYGGIINVRIIDVKKLEKTPTRKEKIT